MNGQTFFNDFLPSVKEECEMMRVRTKLKFEVGFVTGLKKFDCSIPFRVVKIGSKIVILFLNLGLRCPIRSLCTAK